MFADCRDEIYGFLYVYESFMIMITAHGNVGCDVLFFILAMHLCGQIELLKTNMLEIGEEQEFTDWKRRIVGFIQRHSRLLEMAQALNVTLSGVLVMQLFLNAGLNLMLGKQSSIYVPK